MLSALEEQVSGFFLVFLITLKNNQKELLQLNSLADIAR